MRPRNLLRLWRVRLRARLAQECFALAGVAVGVALLFASQIAGSSLRGSVAQLTQGIAGHATLQVSARAPAGLSEAVLAQARGIPGVRVAAPLLEESTDLVGPHGHEAVELIGADASLSRLDGPLVRDLALAPFRGIGAVVLPAPLARAVGVTKFGQEADFLLSGHVAELPLYAQLQPRQIGPLSSSPIAIAPLFSVQEAARADGRLSRILIQPEAGREAQVKAALLALGQGHVSVEPIDAEERLFAKAAATSRQASLLFSVVSALVGFLFAFNALLFSVPRRRSLVAGLRRDGYGRVTAVAALLVDTAALALAGGALGLLLGDELSIHVLRPDPAFLSLAFTLGSPHVIDAQMVALALGGALLAAFVSVFAPLTDILVRDPLTADVPRHAPRARLGVRGAALAGLVCLGASTAILLVAPDAAPPAAVLLIAALVLELPLALDAALSVLGGLARASSSVAAHLARMELQGATSRSVAIASTGAIAVFGSVAVGAAHDDLLAGLRDAAREMNASTDVWIDARGSYNLLDTAPFAPLDTSALRKLPGVRAVRPYRSGFLDYGSRRVLTVGVPAGADPLLPTGQLLEGSPSQVTARVRSGGWLVISAAIAKERHVRIGDSLTLPTADPRTFRVAGLSTNLGWAPGAIIMNAADYARAWAGPAVSAYSVLLAPDTSAASGAEEIRRALAHDPGLTAQTAAQHVAQLTALSELALSSLEQISVAILISAALAMAAAMGAAILQGRPRLAKLKLEGLARAQLWRMVLLECGLLVGVGSALGACFGLYGQQLADRALASAVNFPIVETVPLAGLSSLALVVACAITILGLPGYLAASVPAALALQD